MQRKLLELKRKLFMVMGIMLCFICFTGITVNAAELNAETLGDSEETVISAEERERSVFLDSSIERIPNFFVVEAVVEGSSGSDKIKIIAHNIGIDTIDKISCKVKITDNKGLVQYNKVVSFTDVTPLFSCMSKVNENIRFKLFFANSSAIVDLPTRLAPFIKSAYLSLLFSFHSYISSYIFLLKTGLSMHKSTFSPQL